LWSELLESGREVSHLPSIRFVAVERLADIALSPGLRARSFLLGSKLFIDALTGGSWWHRDNDELMHSCQERGHGCRLQSLGRVLYVLQAFGPRNQVVFACQRNPNRAHSLGLNALGKLNEKFVERVFRNSMNPRKIDFGHVHGQNDPLYS
jgi:hypothetical protein